MHKLANLAKELAGVMSCDVTIKITLMTLQVFATFYYILRVGGFEFKQW